jgi:hypothetical protein
MNSDTPPAAARKAPTKLDTASLFKLLDWMRQHEAEVKDQPDTQLARRASADLGAEITLANFSHARKSARIEKTEPPKPPTVEERLARIEQTLGCFITWSQRELGESGALTLLNMLCPGPSYLNLASPAVSPKLTNEFPRDTRDDHEPCQPEKSESQSSEPPKLL